MNVNKEIIISNSLAETIAAGKKFAYRLKAGDTILFYGELGVGKTEFIKAICEHYAVQEIITSPTFTIVNEYEGIGNQNQTLRILHIDLYRIKKQEELIAIGFEDYLHSQDTIKFIEWAENSFGYVNHYDYAVRITADAENEEKREIEITFFLAG